ncbi:hypothetical protein GCM10010977_17010 [Citricoccus zhacaiensis]|uniref:Integral membrane protein n=1 Tax=Citricoccus zhacaiensis TaxID=489142 RepID=A0ABQ2LZC8_9MICC|nr:hypothetical protein [Citricoccus zhacaiensis]GGO45094.1 hypothetical protein GCM10010977_17010 [Citricoccus zhacaiensis]
MRTVLSILLAVLAGLLAALSLVGARAEALVYTPGPLQQIAAPMSEDPQLREALPGEISSLVEDQLPEEMPGFAQSAASRLVEGVASGLVEDDRFPAAWSAVLEETRLDWVSRIDRLATEGTTPAGTSGAGGAADGGGAEAAVSGTVHLQAAPLVDLGLDRMAEAISGVPGGEAVAEMLREGMDAGAGETGESLLSVDLAVPDPDTVPMDAVVLVVDNLYRWPWLAGTAAVLTLLALWAAPRRRKGTPLFIAGLAVLAAGGVSRWALGRMEPATDLQGIARVAAESLLEGIRDYAMPDTLILIVGGGVVAALGLLVGLASGLRSGGRTGH